MKIFYREIKRESFKAVRYAFEKTSEWIPKSQIQKESLIDCWINIPDWLAKAKGLEEEGMPDD